jgi:hypothetical protein
MFTNAGTTLEDIVYGFPYDVGSSWLAVGWDRSDQPSVTVVNDESDLGGVTGHESYDVSNLLSVHHGNEDLPGTVADLFAAYELLAAAVALNPTLGVPGVVRARVTDYDLTPNDTETGDSAELRFTVHVEAFR